MDIGDRRIGVAVTDPFGQYAVPSDTFFRSGKWAEDVEAVAKLVMEKGAARVVCGLPLHADGTEGIQAEKTRRFVEKLRACLKIPVEFVDERNTTRAARADLNFLGVSVKKDKKRKSVDSLAAAYILENYLAESRERSCNMKEDREEYEEEDNIVELVDDEGNTFRYEHLMTFEYKNEWYVALTPEKAAEEAPEDESEEDEGDEVAIYHLVGGEDDEQLEPIEDDALLDEVFAEFCNQYDDFEDADEAAALEPDEE